MERAWRDGSLLCVAAAVLSFSACTPYYDDYVGVLRCSISDGSIKFGNINFVRKAKNTELKLKYVARQDARKANPDLPISA